MPICSFTMEWNSHPNPDHYLSVIWSPVSCRLTSYSIMLLVTNFVPFWHDAIWNDVKKAWHLLFPLCIIKSMTGINMAREICQKPSTIIWDQPYTSWWWTLWVKYCPTSSFGILAKQESPSFCDEIKGSDRSIFQPKYLRKSFLEFWLSS